MKLDISIQRLFFLREEKLREGKKREECCGATDVQARMLRSNECPSGECLQRF